MKNDLYLTHRPLADMHGDGVYFNKQLRKLAKVHNQSGLTNDKTDSQPSVRTDKHMNANGRVRGAS